MAGIWAEKEGVHIWAGDADAESVIAQPIQDVQAYLRTHKFRQIQTEGGRVGETEGFQVYEFATGASSDSGASANRQVRLGVSMSPTGIVGLDSVTGYQDLNPFKITTMSDLIAFVELGQEKPALKALTGVKPGTDLRFAKKRTHYA